MVGPDATSAGLSPGMSDTTSETTLAGQAAAARRPPLIVETCFRSVFIAEIGAPEASSAWLTAISSASVRPGRRRRQQRRAAAGDQRDDQIVGRSPATCSSSVRDAASPASSGTGCAASMTRMRRQGAA